MMHPGQQTVNSVNVSHHESEERHIVSLSIFSLENIININFDS